MKTFKIINILSFLFYFLFTLPASSQDISIWTIDSLNLNSFPFRGENNLYYTLFPGVTSQDFRGDDLLHIRGSRHDELAYYINGVDVRSDFTGMPLFRIIPQALNNIVIDKAPSVSTSNARAAITHELKQGGERPMFSVNGETDKFTPLYEKRLDTYSYGYNNLVLIGGGTIPKIGTEIFIAGEKEIFDDHYRMFWDGFHITDEDMDLTFITNETWTEVDTGYVYSFDVFEDINELLVKPGNIPSSKSGRTTINGIITQPFQNGLISFVVLHEEETKRINNTPIMHLFNQARLPETYRKAQLYSLQGEYNFPYDIKLNLQADFLRSKESTYDPNFGSNFLAYDDSIALEKVGLPYVGRLGNMYLNKFLFDKKSKLITDYSKNAEDYNSFNFVVSRTILNHDVKIGGNFKSSTYRHYRINEYTLGILNKEFYQWNGYTKSTTPTGALERFLFQRRTEGIGYNMLGEKTSSEGEYHDAPRKPRTSSIYFNDTYRKNNWKLDIGLRYDSFTSDAFTIQDSAIVDWEYYSGYIGGEPIKRQPTNNSWSPRLHITHQINNSLLIFSKFGKYVQFPQLSDVYTNYATRLILVRGQDFITELYSNDTKPVITYQTSIGVSYYPLSNYKLNVEFFNTATSNYLQTDNITLFRYDEFRNNNPVLKSEGQSQTTGLELDFQYNNNKIDASLNYSYSYASGTSSYPISNYPFTWNIWDSTSYKPINHELEYNSQHSGMAFISYKTDENASKLLQNITLSMLGRFDSGHSYTLWEAGYG